MRALLLLICALVCGAATKVLAATAAVTTPIPAEELFRNTTLSQLQFSPDGKRISVFVNFPDGKGLALFDPNSNDFQLIAMVAQTNWIREYRWLDAEHLYLVAGRDDIWMHSIITLRDKQGKLTPEIKAVPANGYLVGQLKGSPTRLLFAVNVGRYEVEYQLFELSIDELLAGQFEPENRIKNLLHNDQSARVHYDPASNRLISIWMDKERRQVELQYRDLNSGKWFPLFNYDPTEFSFSPQQFLGNDSLAVLSDKNSDKVALYRFDLKTQQLAEILFEHPRYDLIDTEFTDGELSAVSYLAHGQLEQQYFTPQQQQLQQELAANFPAQQWKLLDSVDGHYLLLVFSATNAGQYYQFESGKKPQLIGDLLPSLASYTLAPTTKIRLKNKDNFDIESLLTLPVQRSKEAPALIVMPHGGPIGVQDTDEFDPTVQYLASRGYAVLRTNFRGSSGYGKSFSQNGVAELGAGIEQDISQAVSKVQQQYGISRLCAMGYSYGGYSAMMLAIKQPQLYRCVIAGFGVYDLPLLFNASNLKVQPEQQKRVERVVGPLQPGLKERSPVYLANKVQAPVLLIAGMDDDVAGFEQSHRMYDALLRAGKPVEHMFYQDTGHGHDRWDLEHHQIGLIEQFLQQHLAQAQVSTESDQAQQWYRQAELLSRGVRVEKDEAAAISLYQKAANAGHAGAMVALAEAALSGKGLPKDVAVAIRYLQQAAAKQNADAELMLGLLYSQGLYTAPDLKQAKVHFNNAVRLEPQSVAVLYLARALCLGLDQAAQWDKGLQQIDSHLRLYQRHDQDPHSKLLKRTAYAIAAELLITGAPTTEQRQHVLELMQRLAAQTLDTGAEITDYRSGLYAGDGYRYDKADSYPLNTTKEFGSTVKVDKARNSAGNPAAWLLVRWQRKLANGQLQTISYAPVIASLPDRVQLHATLDLAPDQNKAIWILQVFDLQGTELYNKQFDFQ